MGAEVIEDIVIFGLMVVLLSIVAYEFGWILVQ